MGFLDIFELDNNKKRKLKSESIDRSDLPKWVIKAEGDWEIRLGCNPYDMKKSFIGRHYIYTVYFKTISQGRCSEEWKRVKKYDW